LAGIRVLKFLSQLLSSLSQGAAPPGPQALARLRELQHRPLPPELTAAPPRPDVWGERGYLSQPRYQHQYKPLLRHGRATWGLVYHYSSSGGGEDYDFTASYAWFDARGELQVQHLKGGYDAIHAAYGRGQGDIVVDMDAELKEDLELVILQDPRTGEHIPYRALRAEPGLDTPPAPLQARTVAPPTPPAEDWLESAGTFRLEWGTSGKARSARLVRVRGRKRETLFTIQRAGSSNREWSLTRTGDRAPRLRAIHQPALGFEASFRIVDAHDQPAGTVTEKARRVRFVATLAGRQRKFYSGAKAPKEKRTLMEEMQDVLTLERTKHKDRDSVVLHAPVHRSILELFILGLVAVRHPPRPRKAS